MPCHFRTLFSHCRFKQFSHIEFFLWCSTSFLNFGPTVYSVWTVLQKPNPFWSAPGFSTIGARFGSGYAVLIIINLKSLIEACTKSKLRNVSTLYSFQASLFNTYLFPDNTCCCNRPRESSSSSICQRYWYLLTKNICQLQSKNEIVFTKKWSEYSILYIGYCEIFLHGLVPFLHHSPLSLCHSVRYFCTF